MRLSRNRMQPGKKLLIKSCTVSASVGIQLLCEGLQLPEKYEQKPEIFSEKFALNFLVELMQSCSSL